MTRTSVLRAAVAAAAFVLGMALWPSAPAFADPPPWAPAHGWRAKHHHHEDDEDYRYPPPPPPAVYAPPAVIYPPPAVYAPPLAVPPGINIVVPLNFR